METSVLPVRGWTMALVGVAIGVVVVSGQTRPAPAGAKPAGASTAAAPSPGAGPVIVVDTAKGSFEFETYPEEAPKSVEHILALVKRNFYNGQRVHRQEPGFVVQWGDPQSRDMTKRDMWGRGFGTGRVVGAAEFSKKRTHVRGAVGMAHNGDATQADCQIYVVVANRSNLDGKYAVIGKVLSGMDVVDKLKVTDVIKRMSVK